MRNLIHITNRLSYHSQLIFVVTLLLSNLTFFQLSAQNILKGPYLIEPGETEMTIRWEFDGKTDFVVEYGKNTTEIQKINLNYRGGEYEGYLYEANLTNLKPNSTYYYRLRAHDESEWFTFNTFKSGQDKITFVAMGDSRSNPHIFTKVMNEISGVNPDFFISMGDLVAVGGEYQEWNDFYFSVVKEYVASTPIVSTLGDHETNGDDGDLFRYFLRKDETIDKQWFSFDYGIAHFISLDYRHPDNQEMIDWFIKDITSSDKEWNFVYMHRGAYNFGGHRTDWGRGTWPNLFSKYKIDIVFAGHSHLYERFYPVRQKNETNAVVYVTTGGAGAGLYQSVKNESIVAATESVNHFVTIKIDGNKLGLKAIRMDGSLLDKFEIEKNKKGYNKEFEEQIISQVDINTITGFNSAISKNMSTIPLSQRASEYELNLQSCTTYAIPFSIQLNDESAKTYVMEALKDTLHSNEKKNLKLNITRKEDIIVHPWGNIEPELRFKFIYEYHSKADTIIGKAINYYHETY